MKDSGYTVQQLVDDPSFVKWATGDSEGERADYWNQWVKQSEKNRKIALRAQKKITGVRFTSPNLPDIEYEWAKIRDDIKQNKQIRLNIKEEWATHHKHGRLLSHLFKAAAVLLIGAFVGFAMFMYQELEPEKNKDVVHTVKTDYGEKKTLNLSDGSKIILAPGSELTYKSNWLEQPVKRVNLSGEAYFSITPKRLKNRPKFVVETEDGAASVWGTRFTVDTYGRGTQVVLEEGEVRVEVAGADESGKTEMTMRPGEMAQFSKSDAQIALNEVNPTVYTSWTTNELYFDKTPFSVLVNRIERTYGTKVKIKHPKILNMELSGSIDFRSLDGLIDAVSEVMDVRIYKSAQTVIIEQNNNN